MILIRRKVLRAFVLSLGRLTDTTPIQNGALNGSTRSEGVRHIGAPVTSPDRSPFIFVPGGSKVTELLFNG